MACRHGCREHIQGSPFAVAVGTRLLPPGLQLRDLGDGTAGTLTVRRGVHVLEARPHHFLDVVVKQGGILTVRGWGRRGHMNPGSQPADGGGGRLQLRVRGRLVIESGGSIDVSGCGYTGAWPVAPRRPRGGRPTHSARAG
jgi:hypothetical protein